MEGELKKIQQKRKKEEENEERKEERRRKIGKDRIVARFLRLFITDVAHVDRLISSQDLPGRINSPVNAGSVDLPTRSLALGTERLDSARAAIVKLIDSLH